MTARIVFGQVDPLDYREPLCRCGHVHGEHDGSMPLPDGREGEPCWHGWTDDDEGCRCDGWSPDPTTGRGEPS